MSTAPNRQGPFDSAGREWAQLKSGQINLGKTNIPATAQWRHLFSVNRRHVLQKGFLCENRLQKDGLLKLV